SLAQNFTAPAGTSQLRFWYQVHCPDTVTYDWASATLMDNTSATTITVLPNTCTNNNTWAQATASITAGHSYTLTLSNHDDNYASDPTYTLYDDVSTTAPPPPDFSISANPTSVSVVQGSSGTSTISTAVVSPPAQTVGLSASGLPAGASASFNPTSVTAGGSSTLTLMTAATTPTGTYPITVTGTAGSVTHSTTVNLTITA